MPGLQSGVVPYENTLATFSQQHLARERAGPMYRERRIVISFFHFEPSELTQTAQACPSSFSLLDGRRPNVWDRNKRRANPKAINRR